MGCVFCASTRGGKVRDLKASEILDQVLFTQLDSGEAVSNIVMMGIGEPLDNFEQVLRFLTLVNHPDGIHIGMRHISLSTCGLTEQIDKLAQYGLHPLTLNLPGVDRRGGVIGLCRHPQETLFKFHALKSVKYKRQECRTVWNGRFYRCLRSRSAGKRGRTDTGSHRKLHRDRSYG